MRVLELIMSVSPYLRSAMVRFLFITVSVSDKIALKYQRTISSSALIQFVSSSSCSYQSSDSGRRSPCHRPAVTQSGQPKADHTVALSHDGFITVATFQSVMVFLETQILSCLGYFLINLVQIQKKTFVFSIDLPRI